MLGAVSTQMIRDHLPQPIRDAMTQRRLAPLSAEEGEAMNRLLISKFPFQGNQIDWSRTKNHRSVTETDAAMAASVLRILFEQCFQENSDQSIIYGNDGLAIKLNGKMESFFDIIEEFIDVPHTSYFLSADGARCLTSRMDGRMDYGEIA